MTKEEKIRKELQENGIEDNLFDLAVFYSTEIARYCIFSCSRYRNPEVPLAIYHRKNQLDTFIEKLETIYDILDSLSDETVEFLRNTSKMLERYGILNSANHKLLNIQKKLDTNMTQCIPCRDLEYEKIRLEENSDQYKHLLYLREIIDKNENISKDYLSSLIDILNDGENVIKYAWESEYSFYNKSNFIKTHNLSQNDIEYMISYLEKKNIFNQLNSKKDGEKQ